MTKIHEKKLMDENGRAIASRLELTNTETSRNTSKTWKIP